MFSSTIDSFIFKKWKPSENVQDLYTNALKYIQERNQKKDCKILKQCQKLWISANLSLQQQTHMNSEPQSQLRSHIQSHQNKPMRLKSIQERKCDEAVEIECRLWKQLMSPISEYLKSRGQHELSDQLKIEQPSVVKMEEEPAIENFISFSEQFVHPSKLPKKQNKGIRKQHRQIMKREEAQIEIKQEEDAFLENVMKNEAELFRSISSNNLIEFNNDIWRF